MAYKFVIVKTWGNAINQIQSDIPCQLFNLALYKSHWYHYYAIHIWNRKLKITEKLQKLFQRETNNASWRSHPFQRFICDSVKKFNQTSATSVLKALTATDEATTTHKMAKKKCRSTVLPLETFTNPQERTAPSKAVITKNCLRQNINAVPLRPRGLTNRSSTRLFIFGLNILTVFDLDMVGLWFLCAIDWCCHALWCGDIEV